MTALAALEPLLAQAEREVAALSSAIASLYDTPLTSAEAQAAMQRRREELDWRLAGARLRVLELHLARAEQEHAEVRAALQQAVSVTQACEEALREAQRRSTIARERQARLEARDAMLRERRRELTRKMEAFGGT